MIGESLKKINWFGFPYYLLNILGTVWVLNPQSAGSFSRCFLALRISFFLLLRSPWTFSKFALTIAVIEDHKTFEIFWKAVGKSGTVFVNWLSIYVEEKIQKVIEYFWSFISKSFLKSFPCKLYEKGSIISFSFGIKLFLGLPKCKVFGLLEILWVERTLFFSLGASSGHFSQLL